MFTPAVTQILLGIQDGLLVMGGYGNNRCAPLICNNTLSGSFNTVADPYTVTANDKNMV